MNITRHFVRVGDREIHYRKAGKGPPVVLLHVSPQSSAFVLPQLIDLANDYTLIAPDTAGYGASDPLRTRAPIMADYADALLDALAAIGLERVPVYGSHTGANIAVEAARRAPERIAGLVLDGLSLSTPEIAQDRTSRYAPRFEPRADGSHLAWAWQHTRDQLLFWPWYEPHRANRLRLDMADPEYLSAVVLAKMSAADYWLGYRAAFSHDSRVALRELSVDTWFVTTEDDEHTEIERSIGGLPDNIHFVDTTRASQLDAIGRALSMATERTTTGSPVASAVAGDMSRRYVDAGPGQRLVRRCGADAGRPVVMLHGAMATSAELINLAKAIGTGRPVVIPDIAGNGLSDDLGKDNADLMDFAADTISVIDACGIDEFDLYGESAGAALAAAMAAREPGRVKKLVLACPEMPAPDERADLVEQIAPPIDARWDGTHLLTAWHMLRDAALFWPWYARNADSVRDVEPEIEPAALQGRLLSWLLSPVDYADYARAACAFDLEAALRELAHPCLVVGTRGDLIESHARTAASSMPAAELLLQEGLSTDASAVRAFFGD